jgi:lipoprotein-anchoring transpeptidase ErfK/SrfK
MGRVISHAPRIVLSLIAAVTLVLTAGGALGVWKTGAPAAHWERPAASGVEPAAAKVATRDMEGANGDLHREQESAPSPSPAPATTATDDDAPSTAQDSRDDGRRDQHAEDPEDGEDAESVVPALPAGSGSGKRVVFDMSEQRVWLVDDKDQVRRTYLVSGSRMSNLGPGRYEVFSRSAQAVSYTYEETMRFMVRFAHGQRASIGFHDIPRNQRGLPVQTRAQLGNALSSGCIRQARPDALALWRFAPIGTSVVVVR